ncbi:MAG: hypothetical protein JNL10_04845 [Verrucomicrobiales bacterium]|nr:hypothetical protein [Verrucomicrobiales bacterium]
MTTAYFPPVQVPASIASQLEAKRSELLRTRDRRLELLTKLEATRERVADLESRLPGLTAAAEDAGEQQVSELLLCERQISILRGKAESQLEEVNQAEDALKAELASTANLFRGVLGPILEQVEQGISEAVGKYCTHGPAVREFVGKTDAAIRFRGRYFNCWFLGISDLDVALKELLSYFEELLPNPPAAAE